MIILSLSVHAKQEDSLSLLTLMMGKEYKHCAMLFLMSIIDESRAIETRTRIANKDLVAKKKAEPIFEYLFIVQNLSISLSSQKFLKNVSDEGYFPKEGEQDLKAMEESIFCLDRQLAGAIFLLGVI